MTDPLLIHVPERIVTERLIIRCPEPGDGAVLNAAVCDSLDALRPYVPWAGSVPTLADSEAVCRKAQARFRLREDLMMLIFERAVGDVEGELLGGTGMHRMDWKARRFEIGYWRRGGREGRGIASEAVHTLTRLAFDELQAQRVELRIDDLNQPSWRVAERCGFTLEGVMRRESVAPDGKLRDMRVYSKVRGVEEPLLQGEL
ncbi:MAG: GNAT family protein [Burkholderiaceae bacterium]